MKLSWGFALSSLYSAACATEVGHVYILDPSPRPSAQAPSSVDPETARLIFAQRLGLSRFHSINNPTEETVQQINAFGGRQQKLFGGEGPERSRAQLLVWVDNAEDATGTIVAIIGDASQWTSSFTITSPPSAADNDRLINDMILQADSLCKKAGSNDYTRAAVDTLVLMHSLVSNLGPLSTHSKYLSILREDGKRTGELATLVPELLAYSSGDYGYSITVVVMPPSSSHSKRAAIPWGSYDVPSLQPRREATEEPLSPSTAEPASSSNPVSDLEDFPTIMQAEGNDTTPPLGILPSCFASRSECESKTHGCSGHGECSLSRPGGKDRTKCYACTCKPDIKHVGENGMESKIKTTYWGGPACQKKDVSIPFWLFFGSGVLLTFLITTGIGMLYSMGSEELPSVIGAGVSGPVRK
ncbi:hypothetical protein K458DRAFT_314437 [Lentithecium fluviatile CBS 122367]|uniref:Uncharacterized protein n=1 Tax=Lentithecium fluviatile CBS 122367 TaxID=1168545 RepID=A0A6G1IMV3_9PLEO|nr:hypothetical protein K458DRAFT_314437 [Lentithecium fluviatile CBS 122367]